MLRIVLALLLLATPVFAGPDRVAVLLGSHHSGTSSDFEEFNPGVFFEWETEGPSVSVGAYRNSYGRGSVAASLHFQFAEQGDFTADLMSGLAYYPEDGRDFSASIGDVVPIIGLRLRYRAFYLLTLPGNADQGDFILGYGLSFPLQ